LFLLQYEWHYFDIADIINLQTVFSVQMYYEDS